MTDLGTRCAFCGHPNSAHIYGDGKCRPGFACPCPKFTPPAITGVPGLDQEMPARRRPTRDEAIELVKAYLYSSGRGSGDEAVTNLDAEHIVSLVLGSPLAVRG